MATMILSAAGSSVGGPAGNALGGMIGNSIDRRLLSSRSRGPRLGSLTVQTSSYGTQIPQVFGTMRVAGSIIWATDLREVPRTGSSKTQPNATASSYSVSFCVALSSRRLRAVHRIWADGQLIRGRAGDFKVPANFRFHRGDEDQAVDPLIASAEGLGRAPAYRGLALAVFEDLDLGPFGNRIPSLTFEVEGLEAAATATEVLLEASDRVLTATNPDAVPMIGYALMGRNKREALQPILDLNSSGLAVANNASLSGEVISIGREELGCGDEHGTPYHRQRTSAEDLPGKVSISYFEPSREYQSGHKEAVAATTSGGLEHLEVAAALEADQVRAAAERLLLRRWRERELLSVRLPLSRLSITPGSLVRLPGEADAFKVISSTVESSTILLELRRVAPEALTPLPTDAGRSVGAPDVIGSPTRLLLTELPGLLDVPSGHTPLVIAASGGQVPWRSVGIELTADGYAEQVLARRRAIIGEACTKLSDADAALIDRVSHVEVQLAGAEDWLNSCDDAALAAGANLCLLGDELLQFGQAEPIASQRFRLSRLVRGRYGSEWAASTHHLGEPFLLIDLASLVSVHLPTAMLGSEMDATPGGAADSGEASASRLISGEALRPPSPVHLTARQTAAGELVVGWTPRDRRHWVWLDGAGQFDATEQRRYEAELAGASGRLVRVSTTAECRFSRQELEAVGRDPVCSVVELSDLLPSRKTIISIHWSRS